MIWLDNNSSSNTEVSRRGFETIDLTAEDEVALDAAWDTIAAREAQAAEEASGIDSSIELDEDDERILDAVWDKLKQEEDAAKAEEKAYGKKS